VIAPSFSLDFESDQSTYAILEQASEWV
jgi:hypothetical protein